MEPSVSDPTPPLCIDMDASAVVVRVPFQVAAVANNGVCFLVERPCLPPPTPKNGEAIFVLLVSWCVFLSNLAFDNLVEEGMQAASGFASVPITNLGHGPIGQQEESQGVPGSVQPLGGVIWDRVPFEL